MRRRGVLVLTALLGAGVAAGCGGGDEVHTVRGTTANVNISANGLALDTGGESTEGFGYGVPVRWIDAEGTGHDSAGAPACLPPLSHGARIELDYVVHHGSPVVLEIRCESLPTTIEWDRGEGGAELFDEFCKADGHDAVATLDDPCTP